MGLMDILRAAVPATAAARTGYLAGEEQGRDKKRKQGMEDAALQRQSRLDQLKESLNQSEIDENEAQASYYRRRPVQSDAPHTLNTDRGIMKWDATLGRYVPTGFKAPQRASERNAGAREARATRTEQQGQLAGVNKQIDDTRADIRMEATDPSDEDNTRIGQLRQRLDSLTQVGDSLNTVIKGGRALPTKKTITGDQAEYLRKVKKMSDSEIQKRYRVMP